MNASVELSYYVYKIGFSSKIEFVAPFKSDEKQLFLHYGIIVSSLFYQKIPKKLMSNHACTMKSLKEKLQFDMADPVCATTASKYLDL